MFSYAYSNGVNDGFIKKPMAEQKLANEQHLLAFTVYMGDAPLYLNMFNEGWDRKTDPNRLPLNPLKSNGIEDVHVRRIYLPSSSVLSYFVSMFSEWESLPDES